MRLAAILTMAVVLAGCGSSTREQQVVGDWTGKFIKDDGSTRPGANLTFDKDHHLRELFGNVEIEGMWSIDGNVVSITVQRVGGRDIADAKRRILAAASKSSNPSAARSMADNLDKPVVLTLSSDGKTLEAKPDAAAGGHALFTRT